ncbi:MAG: NHLP bacteriocin export ABC transporter permease/ATPase subunit [Eubacteriales bacterium]|nr:NHLP bacteriocin export ABC transporter permease/ATPase subunit [Eubacteriales bacterium]
MGWFDEQIKQRMEMDEDDMRSAFENLASVVSDEPLFGASPGVDRRRLQVLMDELLRYYREKSVDLPETVTDVDQAVAQVLRVSSMTQRKVSLTGAWYRNASGAMLGRLKSGEPVVLFPRGFTYGYRDPSTGAVVKLNRKTAAALQTGALVFYKPLPLKRLGVRDLGAYILKTMKASDILFMALATLAVTLIGLLVPYANTIIFSNVIASGDMTALSMVVTLLVGVSISTTMIGIVKMLLLRRVESRSEIAVSAATVARLLALPASFFKGYTPGELANRVENVSTLCDALVDAVLSVGLTALFSLLYFVQIFQYAPALLLPAVVIILATLAFACVTLVAGLHNSRQRMAAEAKVSGLVFSLFSGVQKIKLAGAEKRAFAKWANAYTGAAKLQFDLPLPLKFNSVTSALLPMIGSIILYYSAVQARVPVADYMSFNASYAMVSVAVLSLSSVALDFAKIRTMMELAEPVLRTLPEQAGQKASPGRVSGAIELNNVSFRYDEHMPLILDNVTVTITPGQYVAIVGKTGCGKTTLLKLLLGFEKPQQGAIYYDGQDLDKLDVRQLRRYIGVVMQDGRLFTGSIYDNIVVSAPWLTVDDAWQAAEIAGIADDIRAMPMGMNTLLSESGGGISGGQRQRLMIARAIAPKPKILMLDEATSALDNITQKHISQLLGDLKSTRIVIAHRLSTIRQCDRIIMIEGGHIAEEGTFDEMMARNGAFADLFRRQQLNIDGAKEDTECKPK